MKVGALNVINAFIEFSLDKSIFEEFLVLIEDFGYLQELKVIIIFDKLVFLFFSHFLTFPSSPPGPTRDCTIFRFQKSSFLASSCEK